MSSNKKQKITKIAKGNPIPYSSCKLGDVREYLRNNKIGFTWGGWDNINIDDLDRTRSEELCNLIESDIDQTIHFEGSLFIVNESAKSSTIRPILKKLMKQIEQHGNQYNYKGKLGLDPERNLHCKAAYGKADIAITVDNICILIVEVKHESYTQGMAQLIMQLESIKEEDEESKINRNLYGFVSSLHTWIPVKYDCEHKEYVVAQEIRISTTVVNHEEIYELIAKIHHVLNLALNG